MKLFQFQQWHFLILVILLSGVYGFAISDPTLLQGEWLGVSTSTWFLIAVSSPIIHQIYVLICWRLELFYNRISKTFGPKGFQWYKIVFTILILSRLLTIIFLSYSNANTLEWDVKFAYLLSCVFFIPSAYLFYSVKKYFGPDRAFGIDHFYPEKLREVPFVKKGIFKYTSNGMYLYGFLILYIPGLLLFSKAALVVALFNHVYIWVHYFFTEKPDMKVIYQDGKN